MKNIFILLTLIAIIFTGCDKTMPVNPDGSITVPENTLGKTIKKNKNPSAVFVSEIDLSDLRVSGDNSIFLPILEKYKISVVSEMDMTNIYERISYLNQPRSTVKIETRNVKPKLYALTNIEDIESVSEYKTRIEKEKQEELKKKREAFFGKSKMIAIPDKNFEILNTEVTQKMYASVMEENPSHFTNSEAPVERVSWYDAVYFCNQLSEILGYTPVYAVDENTSVFSWRVSMPRKGQSGVGREILGPPITQNLKADGFRLPTEDEWRYAAKGGQKYTYSGSNNLDEVGWYFNNSASEKHPSDRKTHSVAQKKPNGYGLYDMSGNVWEWVWNGNNPWRAPYRYRCGGSWYENEDRCEVVSEKDYKAEYIRDDLGFRIVRSTNCN